MDLFEYPVVGIQISSWRAWTFIEEEEDEKNHGWDDNGVIALFCRMR